MAATAGDYTAENLSIILELADVEDINSPNDMLIAANRDKMFNLLTNVRGLVETLETLQKPALSLLAKDFKEIMIERIRFVRERFIDVQGESKWQDFRESNLGTVLLELNAAEDDKYYYILDVLFTQGILTLITDPYFADLKAKEYNFQKPGREPARTSITFQLTGTRTRDVIIPVGTAVTTNESTATFYTEVAATIPAGSLRVVVPAANAREITQEISTNGEPNQLHILTDRPIIPSSLRVAKGSTQWDSVPNFFKSRSDSEEFVYQLNDDETVNALFGDGKNGKIPTGIFIATYLIGGGSAANSIQRNKLVRLLGKLQDTLGDPVTNLSVFNAEAPSGGQDAPTLEDYKQAIQAHARSLGRSITLVDYEDNALTVPGVQRAFAVDRPMAINQSLGLSIPSDDVLLFIVPDTVDTLSTTLIEEIQQSFLSKFPGISTATVQPELALYQTIDIAGTVAFADNSNWSAAMSTIRNAIADYFSYTKLDSDGSFVQDWGFRKSTLAKSKIIALIESYAILGVISVNLTTPTTDVTIDSIKIPKLGSVSGLIAVDKLGNTLG